MRLARCHEATATILLFLASTGCSTFGTAPQAAAILPVEDDALTQMSMAKLNERHGESNQASKMYEAILRESPQNQEAHHRLAVMAAQEQNLELANRHFELALQSGPPTAELLNDQAYAAYLQHDLDKAEAAARQALKLEPQHKSARNNLALILGDKGQFDACLAEFRKVVGEAEAQANLAYVRAMAGDLAGAEETYHFALEKNSTLRPAAHALLELNDRRKGVVRDVAPEITAMTPRSESAESSLFTTVAEHDSTRPQTGPPQMPAQDEAAGEAAADRGGIVAPSIRVTDQGESGQTTEISIESPAAQRRLIPGGPDVEIVNDGRAVAPWAEPTW